MEVTVREWVGRGAFAAGVVVIGFGQVLGAALDPVVADVAGFLGAIGFAVALLAWASESQVPMARRGADLAATVVGLAAGLLPWLVSAEALAGLPSGWQPALVVAGLVIGTVGRANGAGAALFTVFAAGLLLPLACGLEAYLHGGTISRVGGVLLGGGGALLVTFASLDRQRVGDTVTSRTFQYGGGAVLLTALAGALAVGSYTLAHRNDHTWDLTGKQTFTLSDQARRVASELAFDVKVTAFFRPSAAGREPFSNLIERMREAGPRITVEWVDPLREPRRAEEAQITGDQGTVVLEGNGRTRRLDWEVTEDELVRALVMLGSAEDHEVCWSLGHGEPDPDDEFSDTGLGAVRLELEGLNYKVRKLFVANTGIPRDCHLVIVARPTEDWFPYEREALAAFVAEGGRVLTLLDPGDAPELAKELERFGVLVGDDVVLDLDERNRTLGIDDPSFLVLQAESFGEHPITRNLGAAVFMPLGRSVRASKEPPAGLEVVDLLRTGPQAWGETTPESEPIRPDEGLEVIGDVPLMAVVTVKDPAGIQVATPIPPDPGAAPAPAAAPEPAAPAPSLDDEGEGEEGDDVPLPAGGEARDVGGGVRPEALVAGRGVPADFAPKAGGRMVVIGDGDFPSNRFQTWGNNRDLFLNAVAWLVDEEDQIGERPEKGEPLEIGFIGSALWCVFSTLVVPGIAALVAFGAFVRRSRL